jgi:hypothetical protein
MDLHSLFFYMKLSLFNFLFINKIYAISESANEVYLFESTMKTVKQKLCEIVSRNGSALTQARLQAVQNCGAVHHERREKHERSASLNLLLRFQRLLIAQIYCHSHKIKSWNSQQGKLLCIFEKLCIIRFPTRSLDFSVDQIRLAALWP